MFGISFVVYVIIKSLNPEIFTAGQENLDKTSALINTLALITSSYFVVRAVEAVKKGSKELCGRWLLASLAAASIYIIVKSIEYLHLFNAGYHLSSDVFYTYYFLSTMFHYAHVLLGMIILATIYSNNLKGACTKQEHSMVEVGASYCHMVDLVWVVLFPIVYVIA